MFAAAAVLSCTKKKKYVRKCKSVEVNAVGSCNYKRKLLATFGNGHEIKNFAKEGSFCCFCFPLNKKETGTKELWKLLKFLASPESDGKYLRRKKVEKRASSC